jgi:hypothetical protein
VKITTTETRWVVQYQPEDDAPWIVSGSFGLSDDANGYLERQRERRPGVQWRMVHRVTVTTVTEEVVE